MAATKPNTDATGTYDAVRIELTDLDCECCGGRWFQLTERTEHNVPEEGTPVSLNCCGCGEPLAHPDWDSYEGPSA